MKPDLRVPFATFERAKTVPAQLEALFARVAAVVDAAHDYPSFEAALAQLTPGQRMLWGLEELQREVMEGGLDEYFINAAGDTWKEALEGLRLLGLKRLESVLVRALKVFPGSNPPRNADERAAFLGDDIPEEFDDLDEEFYAAVEAGESISGAGLAWVAAHPAEFFLDAA